METQKIVNLLNGTDNDNSKFATKKWYIIDSESNGNYSQNDALASFCIYFSGWKYYYYT